MKVLMVCLGNICRSPLAEGILRHKVLEAGLDWQVDSAGTGGWHIGKPPHRLSQKVGMFNGVDISGQRARQFVEYDLEQFDRIYFMDTQNRSDARSIAGRKWDESKTDLLLNELYPLEDRAVPDPYYGEEEGYHAVFDMISRACDQIIEKYGHSV